MLLTPEHRRLTELTSWKAGGLAEQLYEPDSITALKMLLNHLSSDTLIFFLGLGSNTLIRDAGFPGAVIVTRNLNQLSLNDRGEIKAEAGVSCATLSRFAARQNIGGLEFLAGIPGTVGGALAMNAGANGSETWEFVTSVEVMTRAGLVVCKSPEDFDIAYRKVTGAPQEWFVSATFQGMHRPKAESLALIKQYLDRRQATQPINQANCGCVFRNPPGAHAGQLIEAAGLKGQRIGGAMVSEKHANFIINTGNATAADIEALIQFVSDSIFDKTRIRLQQEVTIVGAKGHTQHGQHRDYLTTQS